jgi:hypothetical protein
MVEPSKKSEYVKHSTPRHIKKKTVLLNATYWQKHVSDIKVANKIILLPLVLYN